MLFQEGIPAGHRMALGLAPGHACLAPAFGDHRAVLLGPAALWRSCRLEATAGRGRPGRGA
eukprot:841647-Alexandrium_andersonii.AAC.1